MAEDRFKAWLEECRDSAKEAYNSSNSDCQPLDEMYELGMYHAYQHALEKYDRTH